MLVVVPHAFLEQKMHIQIDNEEGQVAFEFLLVIAFALGITFMFVYMSVNFVSGYVAHYTNYMASRTYLVADQPGREVEAALSYAENRARDKMRTYPLQSLNMNPSDLRFNRPGPGLKAIYVGTTFRFRKLLSPMRAVGGSERATFLSESFLGKEPLRRTCYDQVCQAMGQNSCNLNMDITLFDNGC